MLNDQENKMMDAAQPKDDVTFKAVSGLTYEFFFPGSGGKWKPMSVRAQTREEAQQFWEANREPANAEEKAEEQTNNE
jgi:hypothetical protein